MTKQLAILLSFLWMSVLIGCSEENELAQDCEPCPEGFTCMVTPFGTSDCVPDRSGTQFDGGFTGVDMGSSMRSGSDVSLGQSMDQGPVLGDQAVFDGGSAATDLDQGLQASVDMTAPLDMVDAAPVVDSPPTSPSAGDHPASRIIRLDIPSSASNARLSGCRVVGRNAGSGLSGVFAILGTNLTDQLQANNTGHIPLVLLSRFLDWQIGLTAGEYGGGALEFYLGYGVGDNVFGINEMSYVENSNPPRSSIRFDSVFSGADFETSSGQFMLETASFSLPFLVELELAWLDGSVNVTDEGVAMAETTLNGYLSFSSVRRIVMAIQTFCNQAPNDSFCEAANRFLDGDPSTPELDGDTSQIARDVILPLMRNLDVRLEGDQAMECDAFCDGGDCIECNAVSVCAVVESEPVEIR
jgi:hypothetical protein